MTPTAIPQPVASTVGAYLSKAFSGDSDSGSSANVSTSKDYLYESNLEKTLQATNHLLDVGAEGNDDLVAQLEKFGLDVTSEMKADQNLFIQSLTEFQGQLTSLKESTQDYIKSSLLTSENMSKDDKRDILFNFNEAETLKEFAEFRSATKVFKNDSDFLVKTLSALRNGLEDAESQLDKDVFKSLTQAIDAQSDYFYETGEVNNAVIQDIMDKTVSLVDDANNRLVSIDNEDTVQKVIQERVATKVDQGARDRVRKSVQKSLADNQLQNSDVALSYSQGEVSTDDLIKTIKNEGLMSDDQLSVLTKSIDTALSRDTAAKELTKTLEKELSPLFSSLSDEAKQQIELQKQAHLEGEISAAQLRAVMEDRLSAIADLTSEQTGQLSLMETRLSHIDENTEKSGQLSSADKIRQSNRLEAEEETADQLQSLLDGIETRDNATVRAGMFAGASSAEDLGEQAMDSLFERFGGDDGGGYGPDFDYDMDRENDDDRRRRRRGRRSQGGRGRRKGFKGLLDKGKGLLGRGKDAVGRMGGASKLLKVGGAATALGLGAYNMFTADNTEERKDAAGSTAGALVGGALGSLLGPLGTVAGAYIGSEVGEWIAGTDWFSSPQDKIPDAIKEKGPQAELDYIGSTLLPEMINSINTQSGVYDEDDIEEVKEYALGLRDKIKESGGTISPQAEQIMNLKEQGASPEMISMFTNTPVEDVNAVIASNTVQAQDQRIPMQQTHHTDKKVFEKAKPKDSDQSSGGQTTIHKTEDNRTFISQGGNSRRDVMRDQMRTSF